MKYRFSSTEDMIRWARENPVEWIEHIFGIELWETQKAVLAALRDNKQVNVASCHGIGKSFLASMAVLWFLFCFGPNCKVVTTASTEKQVEGIVWSEIRKWAAVAASRGYGLARRLPLTTKWEIAPNWFAHGFTSNDYSETGFQGYHADYVLIVVDEAAEIAGPIWNGIHGCLASGIKTRLLALGNPTDPTSEFATDYNLKSVTGVNVSAFETPNFTEFGIDIEDIRSGKWSSKIKGPLPRPYLINPEYVYESWLRWCGGSKTGEKDMRWVSRVLGQFPADSEDVLLRWEWIQAAIDKEIEPVAFPVLGADFGAGLGGDESTLYGNWNLHCRLLFADSLEQLPEFTERTKTEYIERKAILLNGDATGLGMGPCQALARDTRLNVNQVLFGASSNRPDVFTRLKSEIYWHGRTLFEQGLIDIDGYDRRLIRQLRRLKWKQATDGRIDIPPKAKIKKDTGESPDRAEGLFFATANLKDVGWIDRLVVGLTQTAKRGIQPRF